MCGNGIYNPYMYQPYYQTANMARNLGGLSGLASNTARNMTGSGIGRSIGNSLGRAATGRALGNAVGSAVGSSAGSSLGSGLASSGLSGLLSRFSFSGFLNGASKTLNVINQAIPIFYQVRPMINNAKTMFRIMGAVKDDDNSQKDNIQEAKISNNETKNDYTIPTTTKNLVVNEKEFETENPIFFI